MFWMDLVRYGKWKGACGIITALCIVRFVGSDSIDIKEYTMVQENSVWNITQGSFSVRSLLACSKQCSQESNICGFNYIKQSSPNTVTTKRCQCILYSDLASQGGHNTVGGSNCFIRTRCNAQYKDLVSGSMTTPTTSVTRTSPPTTTTRPSKASTEATTVAETSTITTARATTTTARSTTSTTTTTTPLPSSPSSTTASTVAKTSTITRARATTSTTTTTTPLPSSPSSTTASTVAKTSTITRARATTSTTTTTTPLPSSPSSTTASTVAKTSTITRARATTSTTTTTTPLPSSPSSTAVSTVAKTSTITTTSATTPTTAAATTTTTTGTHSSTTPRLSTTLTPSTTTTSMTTSSDPCSSVVNALVCLESSTYLFRGDRVLIYSSFETLTVGPSEMETISSVFPEVSHPVMGSYSVEDFLYIANGGDISKYNKADLAFISTESTTSMFGTNSLDGSTYDAILQSGSQTFIFQGTNLYIVDNGEISQTVSTDNNGGKNPYKSKNYSGRPLRIVAGCAVDTDKHVFISDNSVYLFTFNSKQWTVLGDLACY